LLPRHWELDVNKYDGQLHVHWWKDIETIKIKKIFKSPLPSQGKKPFFFFSSSLARLFIYLFVLVWTFHSFSVQLSVAFQIPIGNYIIELSIK
jgi:hypothetical protein